MDMHLLYVIIMIWCISCYTAHALWLVWEMIDGTLTTAQAVFGFLALFVFPLAMISGFVLLIRVPFDLFDRSGT